MLRLIFSAGIFALLLCNTQADEYWGNCTRSPEVSAELRIRDCTDRINKGSMIFDDREAVIRRGQAYLDSGQYRLAIADYDHALSGHFIEGYVSDDVLLQRGVVYALLGDFQRAGNDIDAALSWAHGMHPANDPIFVKINAVRALLVAVQNGIQSPDVLRQVLESRVHQEE